MRTYIHQREDWPQLHWDDSRIAGAHGELRHRQGRLLGRMESLGFSLRQEAILETLTDEVQRTSEIEGEFLNREQVRSSIARRLGIEIAGMRPSDRNVDGVVEMVLDATRNYEQALTKSRLFGWHAALFPTGWSSLHKITVGEWRKGHMRVVSGPIGKERVHFEAPSAERVEPEMTKFLEWINGDDNTDLVLKAGVAHFWFVTIHPFDDGNGRIARAIADMWLARSERTSFRFYSMSAQICDERKAYYDILERTQKGESLDLTRWLEWFLGCLNRAMLGAEGRLASVLKKARFWDRQVNSAFNQRQRKVLNKLLDGFEGKLTSSKWAKLTKTSQNTAIRDITDLVERGILARDPAGGRSTSYSLVEID